MRIFHLITSLDTGGAETALARLLAGLVPAGFECRVASLIPAGPVAEDIRRLGVEVLDLGMRRGLPGPAALLRLSGLLRAFRPDLLQTWLYHADLLGLVAARLAGVDTVIWNLRCSRMELAHYSPLTRLTRRLCAALSGRPWAVAANSQAAVDWHAGLGYRPREFVVIPNGFDLTVFRPDEESRRAVRRELGLEPDAVLVGLAARFDHMKGHEVFCRAAGLALARFPALRFALCGDGVVPENAALAGLLARHGLAGVTRLLGRRPDMPRFYAGLDMACLSSHGESFPNVVGEAMACAVPCVVTDVGDAARIVGSSGLVVPPRDPERMAAAIAELAEAGPEGRRRLGQEARERIGRDYSLAAMVGRYAALYADAAAGKRPSGAGTAAP